MEKKDKPEWLNKCELIRVKNEKEDSLITCYVDGDKLIPLNSIRRDIRTFKIKDRKKEWDGAWLAIAEKCRTVSSLD